MRILAQVGWKKTTREGQKICVWHNEEAVGWDTHTGVYLTSMSDRNFRIWYLAELEAEPGDRIHIKCLTGLRGKGQDEGRTFDLVYVVGDESEPLEEKVIYGVGHYGPIIKGRVKELSNVSADDLRTRKVEDFLENGF